MMKIGIYSRPDHPIATALESGFALHDCVITMSALSGWNGRTHRFDLVVVGGMHKGAAIVAAYQAKKIPALVYDFGYLKRVNTPNEYLNGHWQVSPGGLNHVPELECSADRFDALGLDIAQYGGDPNGYALVCGQVAGDAAHGQDSHSHRQWLRSQLAAYKNAVYRPHPRGGIAVPGTAGNRQSLHDALAGARLVVTYNSNIGHDALLAGVPVVAHGPAAYSELSGETLPSMEARKTYFNRVAYGQWTIDEMASGEAQRFWINVIMRKRF